MKKLLKIKILAIAIALPIYSLAQAEVTEATGAPAKQAVRCVGKLDRYANNRAPMLEIGLLPIKILDDSLTMRTAVIEGKDLPLQDGYSVSVSGLLMRPGNFWNKTGSFMSVQVMLSKIENGKKRYLSQTTVDTNSVRSPKQLEALTKGQIKVQATLMDIDYVNERANSSAAPAADRVVNSIVECELVNL